MTPNEGKCSLCGGTIEKGFIRDRMDGGHRPEQWVAGEPERSFWRGTKVAGKERYQITAWRCTDCGYLMLFADAAL